MHTEGRRETPKSQNWQLMLWECVCLLGALLFLGISGDPREHLQSHTIPMEARISHEKEYVCWCGNAGWDGLDCFYMLYWYVFRSCCFGKEFRLTLCSPEAEGMAPNRELSVFGISARDEYVVPKDF